MSMALPAPNWRLGAPVTTCRCMLSAGDPSTRRPVWRATQSICCGQPPMWRSPPLLVRQMPLIAIAPITGFALSRSPNRREYISLVASLSFVRVRETWRVSMEAGRLNAYKAAPDAMRPVQRVEAYIQQCGLEKRLIELVKMRSSQINGCAYCLHVHTNETSHDG